MAKGNKPSKAPLLRPGLTTLKQGASTGSKGVNDGMVGNVRGIMRQGTTPRNMPPIGGVRRIMGQ